MPPIAASRVARRAGTVWREYGALEYIECVAGEVSPGKRTSFPQAVKLKEGEVVVFSWIIYSSRRDRNRINKKAMADPRLAAMMDAQAVPFDGKRMFCGGFKILVDLQDPGETPVFKEYSHYDATGLAELIDRGEVSASEVLEAALARAAQVNPRVAAICIPLEAIARQRAQAVLHGPFAGVPSTGTERRNRPAQSWQPPGDTGTSRTGGHIDRQALATDPLHANWYYWQSIYLSGRGRLDEAAAAIHHAIELQPAAASYHEQLAVIEIQRGDVKAAMVAAQHETPGAWQDVALALAHQIGPDHAVADAALNPLLDHWANAAPFQIAEVYALRRDPDNMFKWLDHAWASRDPGVRQLLYDPFILRYQHDPRFAAFCVQVGLPTTTEAMALP